MITLFILQAQDGFKKVDKFNLNTFLRHCEPMKLAKQSIIKNKAISFSR
jgi:hypothetical protein